MISGYDIQNNYAHIYYSNRQPLTVRLTRDSGRIIWRPKGFSTKHTGALLGFHAESNQPLVIHHHLNGSDIITLDRFAGGNKVSFQKEACINDRYTVIRKMLGNIIRGDKYDLFFDNCQMKTSDACNNVRKSPDLVKWIVIGIALIVFFIVVLVRTSSRR